MHSSDVVRFYRNRRDAAADIIETLRRVAGQQNAEVKLIGVSLKDVVHPEFAKEWADLLPDFAETWDSLLKTGVHTRVLLMDPASEAAWLRAEAETALSPRMQQSPLQSDVQNAVEYFYEYKAGKIKAHQYANLEARLYRTDPMLFLIWTATECYVQQYYFRPGLDDDHIPVVKYSAPEKAKGASMHEQMSLHFDFMWRDECSIGLEEYRNFYSRGTFSALHKVACSPKTVP